MKVRFLLALFCAMSSIVIGQEYKDLILDKNVNFYDVVRSAEAYFDSNGKGKGSGYTPYMRWKTASEPLYYPSGVRSELDVSRIIKASEALRQKAQSNKNNNGSQWTELGPASIDSITQHYAPGIGRVECVWADDNNGDTLYMSSRSGGWWRSYNSGDTWQNTTDGLPVSGVNVFSVRPDDHQEILINNQNALNQATNGIYRSTDGGSTWSLTSFNISNIGFGGFGDNSRVIELRHSNVHPDTVFIATTDGLWRSTDNMSTVSLVFTGSINSVLVHPTDPMIAYFARSDNNQRNDIYRTTDGGATWTISETITNNSNSSMKLHTVSSFPDMVVASSGNGVWISEKDGNGFISINISGTSGNTFAVKDTDPNVMLRGVLDIYRSADQGSSWSQATEWYLPAATNTNYVHADFRSYYSVNGTIYIGTDGFMCKTVDDGISWEILSNGANIRENYKLGQSQSHKNVTSCGSQDNGSSYYIEGDWLEWIGADGMEQVIHPCNPDYVIGNIQNGNKRRSKNAAQSHVGINGHESISPYWIAPVAYQPTDFGTIYALGNKLVKSEDWGDNWTSLHNFGVVINTFAIAENNSDIMVATDREDIFYSSNGGASFSQIGNGLPNYFIADVAFDPRDDQTFAIIYNQWEDNNQRIYLTQDGGVTFQNISYNLSAIPGRSIVIDHTSQRNIYVGTEAGVYHMPMNGNSYSLVHTNLPPVAVRELEIHYGSNTIKAATWGRGLWEAPLVGRETFPQIIRVDSDVNLAEDVVVAPTLTIEVDDGDQIEDLIITYAVNSINLTDTIPCSRIAADTYVSDGQLPLISSGDKVYYTVIASNPSGDITTSYRYMYEVDLTAQYCEAAGSSGTGSDYITEVTINNISNPSGKTSYSDFTGTIIDVDQYGEVAVDITLAAVFPPDQAGAWVDWNQDKSFGADEEISMSPFAGNTSSGLATIPPYVEPGEYRIRTRVSYDAVVEPCGNAFGEVEDYTLRVIAACPGNATVTNTLDGTPGSLRFWIDKVCAGDTIFFNTALTGDTLTIYNDPLTNSTSLTIYGHDDYNFTISGDSLRQLLIINTPTNLVNLNLVNATGEVPNGGALINNSDLTMRRVVMQHNREGNSEKPLSNNGTITIMPGISEVKE